MAPTAAMMAAMMVVQAGATAASGFQNMNASTQNASLQRQQASMGAQTDALNAQRQAESVGQFQANQEEDYLGSGVQIQGSPVLQLQRTQQMGQQEVDAMTKQAQQNWKMRTLQANMTQQSGRYGFVNSILGAGSTAGSEYMKYKAGGQYRPWEYLQGQTAPVP